MKRANFVIPIRTLELPTIKYIEMSSHPYIDEHTFV